jgi:FtsH-binding integral membrane protein
MSQRVSRQVALMAVICTCSLLVVLVVAMGLGANTDTALSQAWPLAVVCAAALAFLLTDPFSSR